MADDRLPDAYWELALAVNAAFKGLLGAMGQSGNICASTVRLRGEVSTHLGWPAVQGSIAERLRPNLTDGDVVVIADKVVAASLGRFGPRRLLSDPDPKTIDPRDLPELAAKWQQELGVQIEPFHLLVADEYGTDEATLGTDLPNDRAAELAATISSRVGVVVDVVISDTDTGLDTRTPLIGTVTIGATPLGATSGLNLYEAMRCAVAAEFVRGHRRRIAVVVCKPADRRRSRPGIGSFRYAGRLDAAREATLAYA